MTDAPQMPEGGVQRAGRAICQETCAYKGEPPCYDVRDSRTGKKFDWPPKSCDEPGCIWLARVAVESYERWKAERG